MPISQIELRMKHKRIDALIPIVRGIQNRPGGGVSINEQLADAAVTFKDSVLHLDLQDGQSVSIEFPQEGGAVLVSAKADTMEEARDLAQGCVNGLAAASDPRKKR